MFNRVFPLEHPDSAGPESHIIPAKEGLGMLTGVKPDLDWNHLTFHGAAHDALMAQEGAAGYRIYPAFNGHHNTLVIFAVDASGQLIAGDTSIAIENGERCPPVC